MCVLKITHLEALFNSFLQYFEQEVKPVWAVRAALQLTLRRKVNKQCYLKQLHHALCLAAVVCGG